MTRLPKLLALVVLGFAAAIPLATRSSGAAPAPQDAGEATETARRAVLVTGASSGIGLRTAEVLAENGYFVYAGARKQKDLDALNALDNVQGIRLDVTSQDEIDAAVKTVRDGGRGLYGLINNAGVVVYGPLIELPVEDLEFQMDVNVTGVFRVTRAFAPLLIESGGRVSTTGSISGTLGWGMGGAYCMSKHAVEAYTDVLAQELEPFGVKVSIVAPGNYNSKISSNLRARMKERGYTAEGSRYQEQMEAFLARPATRDQYKEPDEVAAAFVHAMGAENPKRHYLVVPNEGEAEMTIRAALYRVVELNRDQPYTYTREELIELLDETMKSAGR